MPVGKQIQAVGIFYLEGYYIDKTLFQSILFNPTLTFFFPPPPQF